MLLTFSIAFPEFVSVTVVGTAMHSTARAGNTNGLGVRETTPKPPVPASCIGYTSPLTTSVTVAVSVIAPA